MCKKIEWLFSLIFKCDKKHAILEILIIIFAAMLAPLSTLCLQNLINAVNNTLAITEFLLYYLCVLFTYEFVLSLQKFLSYKVQYNLCVSFPEKVLNKFRKLDYYLFEESKSRNVLKQIAEYSCEALHESYQYVLVIVSSAISAIGYLFVISQIHWILSIIYIFFLIINVWINFFAMQFMARLYDSQTGEERQMGYLEDLLLDKNAIFELKMFNSISYIVNLWKRISKIVLSQRLKTTARSQWIYGLGSLISIFWLIFLNVITVWQLMEGKITLGIFIAIINSSPTLIALSEKLSNYGLLISKKMSVVNQYINFEQFPEKAKSINTHSDRSMSHEIGIEFQNVTFIYPGSERKVLDNISFKIPVGETVAFVGENGAGKSTIIKLICGMYKPSRGRVLINGHETNSLSPDELSQLIGVAFQDFEHYAFTIRENVALGNIKLLKNDELIREALKGALADDLKDNLDMILGKIDEDGIDLSGGQWQRIAIARALFGGKKYVILDEPTSAIDPVAESEMYESFRQSLKGRTGVVISHRLASAAFTDRILVISQGKLVESGTHQQLLDKKGIYMHMWEAQSAWYEG